MADSALRAEIELVFGIDELINRMVSEITRKAVFYLEAETESRKGQNHRSKFERVLRDYLTSHLLVRPVLKDAETRET